MRLGEIKIAALHLMHYGDSSITYENLGILANGEYAKEMMMMTDSINRALDKMYLMGALTAEQRKKATIIKQMPNVMDMPIPEVLARLIPYFIKAELYEEDEPSASENAYNLFIDGVSKLAKECDGVETVYRGW
jgi:hypothetical protein